MLPCLNSVALAYFFILLQYTSALQSHILSQKDTHVVVNLQEWTAKATLDIIGRVVCSYSDMNRLIPS